MHGLEGTIGIMKLLRALDFVVVVMTTPMSLVRRLIAFWLARPCTILWKKLCFGPLLLTIEWHDFILYYGKSMF